MVVSGKMKKALVLLEWVGGTHVNEKDVYLEPITFQKVVDIKCISQPQSIKICIFIIFLFCLWYIYPFKCLTFGLTFVS